MTWSCMPKKWKLGTLVPLKFELRIIFKLCWISWVNSNSVKRRRIRCSGCCNGTVIDKLPVWTLSVNRFYFVYLFRIHVYLKPIKTCIWCYFQHNDDEWLSSLRFIFPSYQSLLIFTFSILCICSFFKFLYLKSSCNDSPWRLLVYRVLAWCSLHLFVEHPCHFYSVF